MDGQQNFSGTSIADLRMKAKQNDINENKHSDDNGKINSNKNNFSIEHLVTDINNSLDEFSPSDDKSRDSDFSGSSENSYKKKRKKSTKNNIEYDSMKTYYGYIKEPVIIIILYVFLSQEAVKNAISTYVPQINPSEETGSVTTIGVIIYGVILAVLYAVIKFITV